MPRRGWTEYSRERFFCLRLGAGREQIASSLAIPHALRQTGAPEAWRVPPLINNHLSE